MTERELKVELQERYDGGKWQKLLQHIFASVDFFTQPVVLDSGEKRVDRVLQTGSIMLEDGRRIGIFEVKVADKKIEKAANEVNQNIDIQANRQGLRDIAAKYIDQYTTHAVLVFFYATDQPHYRLSLAAKWSSMSDDGISQKAETNKRRYTYLLGQYQNTTTAARRLLELAAKRYQESIKLTTVIDAFAVEPLNKEFFNKYKEEYEKFLFYICENEAQRSLLIDARKNDKIEQEKPIRDFVKKLLGRIVFLHFLQKKGWLGCIGEGWENGDRSYLSTLFQHSKEQGKGDKFYSQILSTLFFNTLNTVRDGDKCALSNSRVPYLNGGLFEKTTAEAKADKIDFPVEFFQNLLDFFGQYNFTIDENSPEEQEVGIDPEMLGHIFENLLEDNKDKGAFYTPKEIVQYMCRQSLIQYLSQKMPNIKDDISTFIEKQIITDYFKNPDNASRLNKYLDDVKICDPAIGSGAFPIGLLQEIYQAKRYIFPYLKGAQGHYFDTTNVKRNIIQNSIYGVDLENGAVDIARLRFWLALVVDAQTPEPLPNLDYKIMQGNSLLEHFAGLDLSGLAQEPDNIILSARDQFSLGLDFEAPNKQITIFDRVTKAQLSGLLNEYFQPIEKGKKNNKAQIKRDINNIIDGKIKAFIALTKIKLEAQIKEAEQNFAHKEKANKSSKKYKEYENNTEYLANIDKAEAELMRLQDAVERPFFLWHTWFKDVFDANGGFDIIIGNPPYLRVQGLKNPADKTAYEALYKSATGAYDLYVLFTERAFQLLAPTGTLNYIIPDKWVNASLGKGLRGLCAPHISRLISFKEHQVFNVSTYSSLLWISKQRQEKMQYAELDHNLKNNVELEKWLNTLRDENFTQFDNLKLSADAWVFANAAANKILDVIAEQPRKLKDVFEKIYQGIATSADNIYFLSDCREENGIIYGKSKALEKEVAIEKGLVKPLLKGDNVHRYKKLQTDTYVVFPYNVDVDNKKSQNDIHIMESDVIQKKFPLGWLYLKQHETALRAREHGRFDNNEWYQFSRNQGTRFEGKTKLFCRDICLRSQFSIDKGGDFYATTTVYGYIKYPHIVEDHDYFLLALLNSSVTWYFIQNTSAVMANGFYRYMPRYISELPIPLLARNEQTPFIRLVSYILWLKEQELRELEDSFMASYFEQIIDAAVYELYFGDSLRAQQKDVLQHLQDLSDIEQYEGAEKLMLIRSEYKRLYHNHHPVRVALYYMETVREVRTILGK